MTSGNGQSTRGDAILKKLFRLFPDSLYSMFLNPRIRYSPQFMKLEGLITYGPVEGMLRTAMKYVQQTRLEGDYFEFGVFEGRAFAIAFNLAQAFGLNQMRFHAFDSFAGLPVITGVDAAGFEHFTAGDFACDVSTFKRNLTKNGVDMDKISITEGWYDKVLNEQTRNRLAAQKAAVVYLDCDLYESAISALDFITDYVQDGTLLMFDDWFCFRGNPERGEQKAFSDWLKRNPDITAVEYQRFDWQGNSFLLQRSDG